jgi:flagellar hook assembly protein FlgD
MSVSEQQLSQNYPNPFNPETTIEFNVPEVGNTELTIYNIKGQKVKNLLKEYLDIGTHRVIWDGRDTKNQECANGVYFYKLETEQATSVKRMVLLK